MADDEDLSPALGGDRAAFEPVPPPEAEGEAVGAAAAAGEAVRPVAADDVPPELEALARGFEAFFGSAFREVTERLPAALSAIEGLVDAVEEALTPVLNELGEVVREAGGAIQREHLRDDLGDPPPLASGPTRIPIEPDDVEATPRVEIPPVDLPPGV